METGNGKIDDPPRMQQLRRRMVEEQLRGRGIRNPKVLHAFLKVPRHLFMYENMWERAYGDYPLPIGEGQTISQPYTVAFMTRSLKLEGDEKVLDVGSGSGYQTAILMEIAREVYAIERINSIAEKSRKSLELLGYSNFELSVGDGSRGWPEKAPFDAILVAAAAPVVPNSLKKQLNIGGRIVMPVGDRYMQNMARVTKVSEEEFREEDLGSFRFVSLVGAEGWEDGW